jgi:hypothetical protein
MQQLTTQQKTCVYHLLSELINQQHARVLVPAHQTKLGFWFGGGNIVRNQDGAIWLCGRYRNHGDSRTGLEAGQRGLECVIFRSDDNGQSFTKVHSWSKADLSYQDKRVLSIEGTALHQLSDGTWELFISSEKAILYPKVVKRYQKPGTGVWTIDRMIGKSLEELEPCTLSPVLESHEYFEYLHVKDPVVFDAPDGKTALIFCHHPFSWASGNTGLALRNKNEDPFYITHWEVVSRGVSWDIAATRITGRLPIPQIGCFSDVPGCAVYFYDGAECMRAHEENPRAYRRPRGYSCEEIGGAFFGWDHSFPQLERLSRIVPLFVSPWGTGCNRYVKSLVTEHGILAIWQQSQEDLSQPLVGHFLSMEDIRRILGGK